MSLLSHLCALRATGQPNRHNSPSQPQVCLCASCLQSEPRWAKENRDREINSCSDTDTSPQVTGASTAGAPLHLAIRSGGIPNTCQSFCFGLSFLFPITSHSFCLARGLGIHNLVLLPFTQNLLLCLHSWPACCASRCSSFHTWCPRSHLPSPSRKGSLRSSSKSSPAFSCKTS